MHDKASGLVATCVALLWLHAAPGAAESGVAHIQYVEGQVELQRASEPEPEPGELNVPLLPGDRIWTHAGSRAEVRLEDGTLLRLAEGTKIDVVGLGDENVLRLWSGSLILRPGSEPAATRIDTPPGSVFPREPGTYRVDVDGDSLALAVYQGEAELGTSEGSLLVAAGYATHATLGTPPEPAYAFNTARLDAFDRFSEARDRDSAARSVLVRSLPHALRSEAPVLASYGTWSPHPDYGSVWYPAVPLGWAPYRYGRWCYTSYGYAWVSSESWGWAPYHYGRWGHGSRGWYWIPGATWGPAWVSFAFGTDWIGWSPLGLHDRPVYVYDRFVRDVYRRGGPRGHHDRGWSFAKRDRFAKPRGAGDLGVVGIASSGAARVLPSPAVLDRSLTPRAVGRVGTSSMERRRTSTRFDATPRRFASPGRRSRSVPLRTPTRTASPRREGASSLGSRNVPRYSVPVPAARPAPAARVDNSGKRRASPALRNVPSRRGSEQRGARPSTTGPRAVPGITRRATPSRRTGSGARAGSRAVPRGAGPARATPRSAPGERGSGRTSRRRGTAPATPRAAPHVRRATPRRAAPATRGAERRRSAPRSHGSGHRGN